MRDSGVTERTKRVNCEVKEMLFSEEVNASEIVVVMLEQQSDGPTVVKRLINGVLFCMYMSI